MHSLTSASMVLFGVSSVQIAFINYAKSNPSITCDDLDLTKKNHGSWGKRVHVLSTMRYIQDKYREGAWPLDEFKGFSSNEMIDITVYKTISLYRASAVISKNNFSNSYYVSFLLWTTCCIIVRLRRHKVKP
jgi:hypothetical protein